MENEEKLKKMIFEKLSEHIGTDPDDINPEDSFIEDLHMNKAEISDFIQNLALFLGFEINEKETEEIETVENLLELAISQSEVV